LRIGASIFVSDAFPRTADLLAAEGYAPRQLATAEIAKIDAGLSCMSLRWRA
jgi:dimethylargininase